MAEAAARNGLAAAGPAAHDVESEAREEIASFLELGDPGVDFPLLRSRLNQLGRKGARCGGGGDGGDRPVLFPPETQRRISEYVLAPLYYACKCFFHQARTCAICAHFVCIFFSSLSAAIFRHHVRVEDRPLGLHREMGLGRGRHRLLPAHHDDERPSSEAFTKVSKTTFAV